MPNHRIVIFKCYFSTFVVLLNFIWYFVQLYFTYILLAFSLCQPFGYLGRVSLPDRASLDTYFATAGNSRRGVMMPSTFPNMEDRPRLNSIVKNRIAHAWDPGICTMASVNVIKAKPVPEALCKIQKQNRPWFFLKKKSNLLDWLWNATSLLCRSKTLIGQNWHTRHRQEETLLKQSSGEKCRLSWQHSSICKRWQWNKQES